MPRPQATKVWFHEGSGYWCVYRAGKRVYLSKDKTTAQKKLNRLRADEKAGGSGCADCLERPFGDLAREFLEDVQARRAPRTWQDYRDSLDRALLHLEADLTVGQFKKIHLAKLERALAPHSPTTAFKTIHAVQRVFGWAVETDLLEHSPLTGYRKPRPRQRTRLIDPEEFQAMLRSSDAPFRRFLLALRLTGCRPKELRCLLWGHVHLGNGVWVIPDRRGGVTHKAAGRQKQPLPRVVALPDPIISLCRWLEAHRQPGQEHVFLNRRGKPWTATALWSRLKRLRPKAKLGEKGGERIVLYSCRHTYATEKAGSVTDMELAELLGQTTPGMAKKYVHFNTARLKEILKRSEGG